MSTYSTGTVSITTGTAALTGTGTLWVTNAVVVAGWFLLLGTPALWYQVQTVNSDTSITLSTNYTGTTLSGSAYNAGSSVVSSSIGISPPFVTTDFITYNNFGNLFKNFRSALANSYSGVSKTNILCLGDSTTIGTGTIPGTYYGAGLKNNSYPTLLSKRLTSLGYKSSAQNCFGDGGYGSNISTYDSRLSLGSWTVSGNITNICGQTYLASATTSTPMTFTPTVPTDTCEVYYITGNGTASAFSYNINGGSSTVVGTWTGLAWNLSKTVISGTLGSNVYEFNWSSGGQVYIVGFSAYNSANFEISVVNLGWGGSTAESQLNAFPSLANEIAAFNPSLIIMQTGINDWLTAASVTTYKASLNSWIAAKPSNCDIIMMAPIQTTSSTIAYATQAPYQAAFLSVAETNGFTLIDQNQRSGGFTAANAAGLMAGDGTHGSIAWYGDEANFLASFLTQI